MCIRDSFRPLRDGFHDRHQMDTVLFQLVLVVHGIESVPVSYTHLFLPSTAYQNELDDLSIIESRMGGVPLRFDQLATKEDVDSVIVRCV